MDLDEILELPAKSRLKKLRELYEQEEDKDLLIHIAAAQKEVDQQSLEEISHRIQEDKESYGEEEDGDQREIKEESIEDIVSDIQIEKIEEDRILGNLYQSSAEQQLYGAKPPQQSVPQDAYKTTAESSSGMQQSQQPLQAYQTSTSQSEEKNRLNSFGFEEKGDVAGSYHSK